VKVGLPLTLLGSISTNFTVLSAIYTVAVSILLGMNVAMTVFFLQRRIVSIQQRGLAAGVLGIISGMLGVGCAACGSYILTILLAWFGAGALIKVLPLSGGEFGILAVALLVVSLAMTARQIESPFVCNITEQ
jgi:hypothetical protein